MKTFSFANLPPLRDFQFLTDSSGVVLTQTGQLYRFAGQQTERIATPATFTISHFHFLDHTHGAIVGNARPLAPPPQKSELGITGLSLLVGVWLLWRTGQRKGRVRQLLTAAVCLLLVGGLAVSCSPSWQRYRTSDPTSPYTTLLAYSPLSKGFSHYYVGNKGQKSYIARTQNQGSTWETHQIPTNFYLTALTALGQNFLVGTYANEEAGTIPLHGDGDVWIYGNDSTLTGKLTANSPQQPYGLIIKRGIKGFFVSLRDSTLFMFGSDRMPTVPSTAASATPGNIYALPMTLRPNVRLIDVPDTVDVLSLSESGSGELWVTLDNRKPYLSNHNLVYAALPTKKLLRFTAGRWQAGPLDPGTSFQQVAFLPGTSVGYVLTEQGKVFETRTNGEDWQLLPLSGIRTMHTRQGAITWLQGDNQLVYHQPLTGK